MNVCLDASEYLRRPGKLHRTFSARSAPCCSPGPMEKLPPGGLGCRRTLEFSSHSACSTIAAMRPATEIVMNFAPWAFRSFPCSPRALPVPTLLVRTLSVPPESFTPLRDITPFDLAHVATTSFKASPLTLCLGRRCAVSTRLSERRSNHASALYPLCFLAPRSCHTGLCPGCQLRSRSPPAHA